MLTLNVTDKFDVTTLQVSVITGVDLRFDRFNNLIVAGVILTHFENLAAYEANAFMGSDEYDISNFVALVKAGQATPTAAAIETYLMQTGQPFFGATQSTTPSQ